MFLESIYSLYPNFRIDDYPFGSTKIIFVILIAIFLIFLVYISRNVPMVLFGSNIAILIAGILFLICIMIYSNIHNISTPSITPNQDFNLSTNLFLCFSFLCFACESHSMTVSVVKKGRSSTLSITLISVISIFTFLFLLIYFGDWILDFNISEALNLLISNQNLLSYTTFLSCLIISLLGFVLQLTVLNKSLISIFVFLKKASSLIEFIIVFILVTGLVWLVLIRDIGRLLWWTTKFLFFGFPFYAMYPYCCGIMNRGKQIYFVFSGIGILILCYFVFLGFMNVGVLSPKYM
ncbi:hypothetical protein NBO_1131g0001 [Nosema bombycis CQ1]|uniref:Uncharacterized protein n=1 Tax=Nosema bombycis (strain CQ1 / CVCC 102059) TaxID=578461 RepID=R0MBS4_NOSB1|nr:hypothetical protein NBO_1131g0001 [Nosema bombycis CQ1]|eukprot:EOB11490.1 hypothetical protein NBO_1131g0001 [Nosema bombycis CQ1]